MREAFSNVAVVGVDPGSLRRKGRRDLERYREVTVLDGRRVLKGSAPVGQLFDLTLDDDSGLAPRWWSRTQVAEQAGHVWISPGNGSIRVTKVARALPSRRSRSARPDPRSTIRLRAAR